MIETDLTGMDPKSAREYVYNYLISLKKTEKDLNELKASLFKWKKRFELATSKGEVELASVAGERVKELENRTGDLEKEFQKMKITASILKENLAHMNKGEGRSIDTERLVAEMELLVGKPDKTEKSLRETEADILLRKLKEELRDQPNNNK